MGIGIHIEERTPVFSIGQIIDAITLQLEGKILTFEGEVNHISAMDPDGFLYGIEFIEPLEENTDKLRKFVKRKLDNIITDGIT